MTRAYERGVLEIGYGVFAYLQPDGSLGWSNAGLVSGPDSALLFDRLFDLHLTRRMHDELRRVSSGPLARLITTPAPANHWNRRSAAATLRVVSRVDRQLWRPGGPSSRARRGSARGRLGDAYT